MIKYKIKNYSEILKNPKDTITYYAPKTYIKNDILEGIVIDSSDEKHLPRTECKKKDSKIYETDDLVEIFIDPDGDGKNYLEIGVNAFSTHYDMLVKCISPECGGWNMAM